MRSAYLLDTNVISELMTDTPNSEVIQFLANVEESYLSVITLHELHYGLNLLPFGQRRNAITVHLKNLLLEYHDYILPITPNEAAQAADVRAKAKQQGKIVHLADALIASTASTHKLIVATRNVKDFENLDVEIVNPWNL